MKIALLTIGTFDLFHAGHVDFLRRCALLADEVTVGVNTDAFVAEFKELLPTLNLDERMDVLRGCKYVDHVRVNPDRGSSLLDCFIRMYPRQDWERVVAIGSDWREKDYLAQVGIDEHWLTSNGVTLIYLHELHHLHSSEVRRRWQQPPSS